MIGGRFDKPLEEILAESVNCITAKKAQTAGMMLSVFLPRNTQEVELYEIFQKAASFCKAHQLLLQPGETLVSDALLRPVVSAAAYAASPSSWIRSDAADSRCDSVESNALGGSLGIWMLGWTGAAGGARLVAGMHQELSEHFSGRFLKEAASWGEHLLIGPEENSLRI